MLDNMKRLYDTTWRRYERCLVLFFHSGLILLCCLSLWLFVSPIQAHELPDLGNSASAVINAEQEYALGRSVMKELRAASLISQDMILNEYLQGLGYRLIAPQGQQQGHFQFFAIEDRTINAFALPGGFIGVHTGLILSTESEGELAGVIAHEVAHVQQRHIARMVEHMGRVRLSTIAGLIASALIATQSPQAGNGVMAATLAGSQQAMINFTRDHEKEADSHGIQSLMQAGFDPMGMPAFFHRMYQDTRFHGSQMPEYLMTHPLTENRLIAAQTRAHSFPYKQIPDGLQYHLVQARVQVHSFTTAQEAESHFAKKLERGNYRSQIGTIYGYALALLGAGKPERAKAYLDLLVESDPNQALFQLAYAQYEIETHQGHAALSRLSTALQNHPKHFPLTFTYCETLLKMGQAEKAIPVLKQQLLRKPPRPIFWHLLSAANAASQHPVQAHLAQAQYLKLQGDFNNALVQLRLANKLSPISGQEKNQIEAEMRDLQSKQSKLKS